MKTAADNKTADLLPDHDLAGERPPQLTKADKARARMARFKERNPISEEAVMGAPEKAVAVVVKMKGRYFYAFGKLGQVKTACYLVGAKMFFPGDNRLAKVVKTLEQKGKKFEVMLLGEVA